MARWNEVNLDDLLRDETDAMKQAAADILNKSADIIVAGIRRNITKAGIKDRTENLRNSITHTKATPDDLHILISSEVFAVDKKGNPVKVKNPGKYNPDMRRRYKHGVPYGRLLEFSPQENEHSPNKKHKHEFFYKEWSEKRGYIRRKIADKIKIAWSKG